MTDEQEIADRAREVVALAESRPPTLATARLICVDGMAGSGKTTLAGAIAEATGAPVVHVDDLLPGWRGLPALAAEAEPMLRALAQARPGTYRHYDWFEDRYSHEVVVEPTPLLVFEGVGSGQTAWADLITVLVWLDADLDERRKRGLERDGVGVEEKWLAWEGDEEALLAREHTDERADLRWSTT